MPRRTSLIRCFRCRMHLELCVCDVFPRFELKTKIIPIIHAREYWRPSNTGYLTKLSLENSEIRRKSGRQSFAEAAVQPEMGRTNYVLFPAEGAMILSAQLKRDAEARGKPITLFVPDGSWRQASKMVIRDPVLSELPKVIVPEFSDRPSVYRLRKESRPEGLATFEAIARAVGALEGDEVCVALERAFRKFTDRILWTRGHKPFSELLDSLPATVRN